MLNRVKNKNRQPSGLTETFLHFRGALERLVRKIVRQDEVEDIIAETYLRTFEHFGDAEIAYPKAFLYKTARNLALNHISRHENRFTQSIEDFPRYRCLFSIRRVGKSDRGAGEISPVLYSRGKHVSQMQ